MALEYEGDLPPIITDVGGEWYIQGKRSDSDWEVLYCIALWNAGWRNMFEYKDYFWINGRPLQIDLRVFTVPKQSFVFLDGIIWHTGDDSQQDQWERQQLFMLTKNYANPPIVVKNPDLQTYEACLAHVGRTFGTR